LKKKRDADTATLLVAVITDVISGDAYSRHLADDTGKCVFYEFHATALSIVHYLAAP